MKVAVTGGSGFVGRTLCKMLKEKGHEPVVLTQSGYQNAQYVTKQVNYHQIETLETALAQCDAVIHLIGILHETRHQSFDWVHHRLVKQVLAAMKKVGIQRYVHMSALGADRNGPSQYLISKAAGEQAALDFCQQNNIQMVSFRPSIIFGEDDDFFNQFAKILRFTPVFPMVCPDAQFQPVAVEDVAKAFIFGLENSLNQEVIELGGKEVVTMRQVLEKVCQQCGYKRLLLSLPDWMSATQGKVMGLIPGAPFTYDNYLSMQKPNITQQWAWSRMGIEPAELTVRLKSHSVR